MAKKRFTLRAGAMILGVGISSAGMLLLGGCSSTESTSTSALQSAKTATKKAKVTRHGEVYLFRGLANVFSLGIDTIGEKMVRRGLDAKVYNHSAWRGIAEDIIARSKSNKVRYPVVIMGHSLGGNATMQMSKLLGDNGVRVAYAVSFDPTITTFIGPNVANVLNYYLPNSDHTNIVKSGAGFQGTMQNLNVSSVEGITHTTIEKYDPYQANVINTTMKFAQRIRPKVAPTAINEGL